MDALIEADRQSADGPSDPRNEDASSSSHDALPSLEQVDDDYGGGGFIVEEQTQGKEQLSGNKRKHSELGQAEHDGDEQDGLDDFTADDIDRLIAQHEQSNTTAPQPPPQPRPQSQQSPTSTSTSAILACSECHVLAYNVPYYKAFNVLVCNGCQSLHPTIYQLITKSTAKAQYLTSDADLFALPHLLRPNPTKGSFANMKLYRKLDVLKIVEQRYGSESGMEDEKRRRELERVEKDVAKRRKGRLAIEKEKRVREWRMEKEVEGKGHKHTFVDVPVKGGAKKQKCSSCGFSLEFEEL